MSDIKYGSGGGVGYYGRDRRDRKKFIKMYVANREHCKVLAQPASVHY